MSHYQSISVRIPIEIFEKIKEIAAKERRSMNQQIVLYLEEQINKEKAEAACK